MAVPIFKHFQATSFFKAFVINGIVAALIATLTIEVRIKLEKEDSNYSIFTRKLFNSEKLNEYHKMFIVFGTSFLISLVVYHLMLLFFSYGGGMLAPRVFNKMSLFSYFNELV